MKTIVLKIVFVYLVLLSISSCSNDDIDTIESYPKKEISVPLNVVIVYDQYNPRSLDNNIVEVLKNSLKRDFRNTRIYFEISKINHYKDSKLFHFDFHSTYKRQEIINYITDKFYNDKYITVVISSNNMQWFGLNNDLINIIKYNYTYETTPSHEIAHSLGLDHSNDNMNIMHDYHNHDIYSEVKYFSENQINVMEEKAVELFNINNKK